MKVYKIVVRDVYEIEAKSPKEAKEIYDKTDKGEILEEYSISKPKLIKKD
tara:strand:+ start:2063 stop:2212 length:150 start_codon:yes stop_codon:yes gene_type:complete